MAQKIKRFKGCCMMCARWIRGQDKSLPANDLRRAGGKVKRRKNRPEDE